MPVAQHDGQEEDEAADDEERIDDVPEQTEDGDVEGAPGCVECAREHEHVDHDDAEDRDAPKAVEDGDPHRLALGAGLLGHPGLSRFRSAGAKPVEA